ncbi:hypothetical protein FVE85_7575 [Porphyridium purpureum]|uniref:Sulfotransferase domain-containing protein n=1 Tax=Porphyridium purpureum TaxID=35688 RepID=A0A5J4ZA36_PORPP|nr:hypothetical protein FVE85_7575 [Porphyridium purpureum]|eukprot:POR9679..scf295_1
MLAEEPISQTRRHACDKLFSLWEWGPDGERRKRNVVCGKMKVGLLWIGCLWISVASAQMLQPAKVLQQVQMEAHESAFVADDTAGYPIIVNLAFGKSGTTSLTEVLKAMGYGPLHWFAGRELPQALFRSGREDLVYIPNTHTPTTLLVDVVLNIIRNGESLEMLSALNQSTRKSFRAFTEIPMWRYPECKYPQITHLDDLVRLNPKARFIMTVREIHSHVHSMIKWRPRYWMAGNMAKCANLNESDLQNELERWVTETNNQVKRRMAAFKPPVPLLELDVSKDHISTLLWHVYPDGRVPLQVKNVMDKLHDKFPVKNLNTRAHEQDAFEQRQTPLISRTKAGLPGPVHTLALLVIAVAGTLSLLSFAQASAISGSLQTQAKPRS